MPEFSQNIVKFGKISKNLFFLFIMCISEILKDFLSKFTISQKNNQEVNPTRQLEWNKIEIDG